jgi:hypothetical protein
MTPNRGQWDERIRYSMDLNQGKLYLEETGLTYYLTNALDHNHSEHVNHSEELKGISYHVIKQEFIGSNSSCTKIEKKPSSHYKNFILGSNKSNWKSTIYSYSEITYSEFYSDIDLFYSTDKDQLSYNFRVLPNGNPNLIKFKLSGAESISIDSDGNLRIKHRFGDIIQSKPVAWNTSSKGTKKKVSCTFSIENDVIGFFFPDGYDKNEELIIDPSLTFSTFTGSTADNWGFTATPDINGNLFGGGIVFGTGYPLSTGAYDVNFNSGTGTFPMDVGITKYNASGTSILYSTYIGGSGNETPHSIVCAPNGELYI